MSHSGLGDDDWALLEAYIGSHDRDIRDELVQRLTIAMRGTISKYFDHGVDNGLIWDAGIDGIGQAVDAAETDDLERFWPLLVRQVVAGIGDRFVQEGWTRQRIGPYYAPLKRLPPTV